jgi:hypothetical protein
MLYKVKKDGPRLPEGLTREPKTITILSGDRTRFAVVICADLNDRQIPFLLNHVGVNLLIVPALTPHEGAFEAAIAGVCGLCQGIAFVVNRAPPAEEVDGDEAFLLMYGLPKRRHAVTTVDPERGRRISALLDLGQQDDNNVVDWIEFS